MESADREVQEFQSLLMQISTEPDNSKREQMESSLLQKLNSATFILLLKKILPDPKMIAFHNISATLLKQFSRNKLSNSHVPLEERAAVMEEIFRLMFDPLVSIDTKEILTDSIKVILIKSESRLVSA